VVGLALFSWPDSEPLQKMSGETIVINAGENRHAVKVSDAQAESIATAASSMCLWKVALFLLLIFIIVVIIVAAWRWWGNCNTAYYARNRANQANYRPLDENDSFW